MSAESIKVCMRFRKELGIPDSEFAPWEFYKEESRVKHAAKEWTYDYLLTPDSEQDEMYEKVGKQTISDFLNGYNGTIFAYGQSGSGKTFSMLGPEDVTNALARDFNSIPEEITKLYGITPRAVIQIFQTINEYVSKGNECILSCSYIEIYNEQINCLLNRKENLKIREHPIYGMYVADKETRVCKTPEEIFEVISIATKNRAVAGTNQNARSSRSHTILLIELEYNGLDGIKRLSKLNLVDLAGSERIAKTGAEGQRLKEAQKINQSLTTLGMCIMALTTPNSKHIPYRNSKLTLILKESLGGSAKTTLLCTASRLSKHEEESIQTLYFASRAKSIKNVCKVNLTLGTKELQYLADHLKLEIMTLRGQLKKAGVPWNRITDPKLLAFISNDLEDGGADDGKVKEDFRRRRASLVGLSEDDIILKYVDLRNKYDALLENARDKIYKLETAPRRSSSALEFSDGDLKEIKQTASNQIEEIVKAKKEEIDKLNQAFDAERADLNARLIDMMEQLSKMEGEKSQFEENVNILKEDMDKMKQTVADKEKELIDIKNEYNTLKIDNENLSSKMSQFIMEAEEKDDTITQLKEKNTTLEKENNETSSKLTNAENQNSLDKVEIENLKKTIESKNENETKQNSTINELHLQITTLNEEIKKKDMEMVSKISQEKEKENEYQKTLESLTSSEKNLTNQIQALKQENDKLSTMLNEKISAQDLLVQKEKVENETRKQLEQRIDELSKENSSLKSDIINQKTSYETEKNNLQTQIDCINREHQNEMNTYKAKATSFENSIKSLEEQISMLTQKESMLSSQKKQIEDKNALLENTIISMKTNETTLSKEIQSLKEENDKKQDSIDTFEKSLSEANKTIAQLRKDIDEIKASSVQSKQQSDTEILGLKGEIATLKSQIAAKDKQIKSDTQKQNELKSQITTLQNVNKNLQAQNDKLSLENSLSKKGQNLINQKSNAIKEKVPLNKNIFGVVLKKVVGGQDFIQKEKDEFKKLEEKTKEIFKDNEMFKDLRKNNIITLSPETISSRDDMADLPELDFTNEETYLKAEQELLEKEKLHQQKKEKEKIERMNSQSNF